MLGSTFDTLKKVEETGDDVWKYKCIFADRFGKEYAFLMGEGKSFRLELTQYESAPMMPAHHVYGRIYPGNWSKWIEVERQTTRVDIDSDPQGYLGYHVGDPTYRFNTEQQVIDEAIRWIRQFGEGWKLVHNGKVIYGKEFSQRTY